MHSDHQQYVKFTSRARLDKAVNSLSGIIEGISIDGAINASELGFLHIWLSEHAEFQDRHPFNEFVPVVQAAVADGVLTLDEREDIIWLCERLRSTEYYDKTTADLQRLHAMVGGIVADGVISAEELRGLSLWLQDHEHLKTCWPYDEIDSLVTAVLADKKIDEREHKMLKDFFGEFIAVLDDRTITSPQVTEGATLVGLCAVCPEIEFEDSKFCFTGASARYTRSQLVDTVSRLGGEFVSSVTAKVKYLVIGAEGNPCWAYACYGRKVEKAVELRKSGVRLLIIHENDFHDAVADSA
jgi:BRCA1 C Terminus (BRCT) domain